MSVKHVPEASRDKGLQYSKNTATKRSHLIYMRSTTAETIPKGHLLHSKFAQRSNNSDSNDVDFKRKREIKDMVQYLVDCCMKRFKAARLFSPHKICRLRPAANDIDTVA